MENINKIDAIFCKLNDWRSTMLSKNIDNRILYVLYVIKIDIVTFYK